MPNSTIEVSSEDVSAFANEVDQCLKAAQVTGGLDLSIFVGELAGAARRLSEGRMQTIAISSCGVTYHAGDMEYDEWAMALLLMARSVESLRRKARDGHCYAHAKPCNIAQPTEMRVWNNCLESFEKLLVELKAKDLSDPN
jgi:hypothetical protein